MLIKFFSSFGQYKNMSYNFGRLSEVKINVDEFLEANNLSFQKKLVVCNPIHKNKFAFLDEALYKSLDDKEIRDRFLDLDGIITNLPNVPVCFKPADCAVVAFAISSPDKGRLGGVPSPFTSHFSKGKNIFALLHIGLDDYLNDIISAFKEFIVGMNHDLPLRIGQIHVFPFLEKYRIDYGDFHSDKYDWNELNKLRPFIFEDDKGRYVNFHYAVWQELCKFWPAGIIKFDEMDTFELAKERKCFSHSLSHFHPEFQNGRNMAVGEILGF